MLGDRFEKDLLNLIYRKYVLKMRNNYINKKIREKCSSLYESRKNIRNELKVLKQRLLTERDPKVIQELQNRIFELEYELEKINNMINEVAKKEIEIKEIIKNEIKNTERQLKDKIKSVIDKERDIHRPVEEAIQKGDPILASIVIMPDEPEGIDEKVVIVRGPVPGSGVGGRGV